MMLTLKRFAETPIAAFRCVAPAELPQTFMELCEWAGAPADSDSLVAHLHIDGSSDIFELALDHYEDEEPSEVWIRLELLHMPAGDGSAIVTEVTDADDEVRSSNGMYIEEFVEHLEDLIPSRLTFRCWAEFGMTDERTPVVALPLEFWKTSSFPLGRMVGARFELNRRGMRDAWIAFDVREDDTRVNISFRRDEKLGKIVETAWRAAVDAFSAATVARRQGTSDA